MEKTDSTETMRNICMDGTVQGRSERKKYYLQDPGVTSEAAPSSSVLWSILWAVCLFLWVSAAVWILHCRVRTMLPASLCAVETAIQILPGYKNYKHLNVSSLIGEVNILSESRKSVVAEWIWSECSVGDYLLGEKKQLLDSRLHWQFSVCRFLRTALSR